MSIQALTNAMALRGVSPSEKLLLLALANYADEHMRCFPSQRRLAEDTCLSDRTIRTLLAGLEARQYLTRQERLRTDKSRGTDLITLNFDAAQISGGAEMISGGVGKSLPGGAETASALTTFEPSPEPSEEPSTSEARVSDWKTMLEEARAAAGDMADLTRPAMHHAADLRSLVEPSSGEPCLWSEVIDAIAMTAMRQRAKGRPITSWSWVKDDAWSLRDKRLNATAPEVAAPRSVGTGAPTTLTSVLGAENTEARRRAFELLDARKTQNG